MHRFANHSTIQLLSMGLLLLAGGASQLWAGKGACCNTCPQCDNKICVAQPETTKQKKHCWEVECKDICIPRFKWPWECCDVPPRCGQVKTVKVLKKKEYECEKCGYKWEVKTVDCDCCPTAPTK